MATTLGRDDIAELRELSVIASRPAIRAWLEAMVVQLEGSSKGSAPPAALAPPTAATPTVPSSAPVRISTAMAAAAAVPAASAADVTTYETLKYGFSSEGADVEVLLLDLPGVGALPRDAVSCDFTATSFDLRIRGLAGRNYRLRIPQLEKEIVPHDSRVVVGKSRVTLKLRKAQPWDWWDGLASSKASSVAKEAGAGAAAKGDAAADPMSGLMDMMKQMYNDGDDSRKKMIAEVRWGRGREGEAFMRGQEISSPQLASILEGSRFFFRWRLE